MFDKYVNHVLPDLQYNPVADCEWILKRSGLPWLLLNIQIPHDIIFREIQQVQHLMTSHRQDQGEEHSGWQSFCIHGKSYDATREEEYYQDSRPYKWTDEAQQLMPKTVDYFKNHWPVCQFLRLRIMLLKPGGYITIHRDSLNPGMSPINVAITQPHRCEFVFEKFGKVPFFPGSAFLLDVSNRHVVFNDSNLPRWHLIIHQTFDEIEMQQLVVKSYQKMYYQNNENSKNSCP